MSLLVSTAIGRSIFDPPKVRQRVELASYKSVRLQFRRISDGCEGPPWNSRTYHASRTPAVAQEEISAWIAMSTMTAEFASRDLKRLAVSQADRLCCRHDRRNAERLNRPKCLILMVS